MYSEIKEKVALIENQFSEIPAERKNHLAKIAQQLVNSSTKEKPLKLIFVCTHNSRRSQFAEVWANVIAEYYELNQAHFFSGGTEVTAFHPNAIAALAESGFKISATSTGKNPLYKIAFSDKNHLACFSKLYDNENNPKTDFSVLMTCAEADENCPYIPGAKRRASLTFEDPKVYDGQVDAVEKYKQTSLKIATEICYLIKHIKNYSIPST
ncbi:MAG: protein-tyrosine-phosphatase [Bacteroidota bacterium]